MYVGVWGPRMRVGMWLLVVRLCRCQGSYMLSVIIPSVIVFVGGVRWIMSVSRIWRVWLLSMFSISCCRPIWMLSVMLWLRCLRVGFIV